MTCLGQLPSGEKVTQNWKLETWMMGCPGGQVGLGAGWKSQSEGT